MLVLTRKIGECINIGDNIVISVIEISKGKVRLGIEAPDQVAVLRKELYLRIKEENIRSSKGTPSDLIMAARLLREKHSEVE
ncbi:MAG: carbon storage regulator CsrA [Desulfobacterales bacterium]|nr:carbon storage regulator CsrA [Desulfobacterales bacterium]